MHDPREGVTPQGMIRTGAARCAIAPVYAQVLRAAARAVAGRATLSVYGSVATGAAVVPTSDVDLLSVGLPVHEAERISADLSARFRDRCREVSLAPASWEDLEADSDEGYGLRVFLRHYCVHLVGADPAAGLPEYRADARAARGFNGDIARHVERWRSELEGDADVALLGTRIARKTLLAVAGLVSVRNATWSTDRRACAARWNELEPGIPVDTLVAWLDTPPRERAAVRGVLQGPVAAVVQVFGSEIGLWVTSGPDRSP
jgi:uncharacterized protein